MSNVIVQNEVKDKPMKECRDPKHEGSRWLVAGPENFYNRQARCKVCYNRNQQEKYHARTGSSNYYKNPVETAPSAPQISNQQIEKIVLADVTLGGHHAVAAKLEQPHRAVQPIDLQPAEQDYIVRVAEVYLTEFLVKGVRGGAEAARKQLSQGNGREVCRRWVSSQPAEEWTVEAAK